MDWNQVEGKWNDVKGQVKDRWGKLTDDDLTRVDGKKDKLIGLLQQNYGMAREKAEHEIAEWLDKADGMFGKVKERAREGFDRAREGVDRAREQVGDVVQRGRQYLQEHGNAGDMARDLRDVIVKNPVPAVLIGLGIGYLLGRLTSGSSSSRS